MKDVLMKDVLIRSNEGDIFIKYAPKNTRRSVVMEKAREELSKKLGTSLTQLNNVEYYVNNAAYDIVYTMKEEDYMTVNFESAQENKVSMEYRVKCECYEGEDEDEIFYCDSFGEAMQELESMDTYRYYSVVIEAFVVLGDKKIMVEEYCYS